jgi:hypothetical protein
MLSQNPNGFWARAAQMAPEANPILVERNGPVPHYGSQDEELPSGEAASQQA